MIARIRDWLLRRHDARKLPDPTFGTRIYEKRRRGIEKKMQALREAHEMGIDYAEINRAAFGRPPYTERRDRRDA
jgi:hypothetical protein